MSDPNLNTNREMLDSELDALLRAADPAQQPISDKAVRQQWTALAATRRQRIRRLRYGGLATAACLLMAFGIGWQLGFVGHGNNKQHANVPQKPIAIPKQPDSTAPTTTSRPDRIEPPNTTTEPTEMLAETDRQSPTEPTEVLAVNEPSLVEQFEQAIAKLPLNNARQRYRIVEQLRRLSRPQQRELLLAVPEIQNQATRRQAMGLISVAAGSDATAVQTAWLSFDSTRDDAWQAMVDRSDASQWDGLIRLAQSDRQKRVLCRKLVVDWQTSGLDRIVELTSAAAWRPAVQIEAAALDPQASQSLLKIIDARSQPQRVAGGFVLAAMKRPEVDRILIQLIVQGRSQMAAYQGLIIRNTTEARQFLAHASVQFELSPAFAAARRRWMAWGPQAFQWVTETRSRSDVQDSILRDDSIDSLRMAAAASPRARCG
ncbi:hypothetical protein Poly24_39040 [Rosistilla carotiformis]|uniref:Uncharacterized protein n=1 Tax=Rosistilla carotiformis TaxID=2528017 RepID=A0A518JXC6_9BACT|nr:hypothetical protein [Rosistilla carotiformis]QDV70185.1 hypothetical protein Poly24_39040 [Rosistilla carotiformis]